LQGKGRAAFAVPLMCALGVTDMPRHFAVDGEITALHAPRLPEAIGSCKISRIAFHNNSTPIPASSEKRLKIRDVANGVQRAWSDL